MPTNKPTLEVRNKWRKVNYQNGRFGSRVGKKFNRFEKWLIMKHIIHDRTLAKLLHTSTSGIQATRWRIKINYKGMYR